jgi:hypothetical protein
VSLSEDHDRSLWIDPQAIPPEVELMDDLADVLAKAAFHL